MNKQRHTPGPWTASGQHVTDSVLGEACLIATVHPNYTPEGDHTEANARLIAAAPDLLAGCLAALSILEAESEACGIYSAHRAKIQAAVDAARGEA